MRIAMIDFILRRGWLLILVVFAATAWLHLGFPNQPVFDEIYSVQAAQQIAAGVIPYEQTHPPFSKIMMALAFKFWLGGQHLPATADCSPVAYAMRTPSVLAGLVCLCLTFAIGQVLWQDRAKATVAMAFLALDSTFLVFSRTAMTNIYGMAFTLLMVFGAAKAMTARNSKWLILAGIGLGLGGASRWTTFAAGIVCVFLLIGYIWFSITSQSKDFSKWLFNGAVSFLVIPPLLYFSTYLPDIWSGTNHDLSKVFSFATLQYLAGVLEYATSSHRAWAVVPTADYSQWYTWPFMLKPVWLFWATAKTTAGIKISSVWAIGNGMIWWTFFPAIIYGLCRGILEKKFEFLMISSFAIGLWIFWAFAKSPINYLHYFFETIPFVCLLLSDIVVSCWRSGLVAVRLTTACYSLAVVAWAIYFYPLLTAKWVEPNFVSSHMFFGAERWDFETRLQVWRKEQHLESESAYKNYLNKYFYTPEKIYFREVPGGGASKLLSPVHPIRFNE